MAGYILLAGGAEFTGLMAQADRKAIELAGGMDSHISIIPAAAAPDNNDKRAGGNGVNWFRRLGASNVETIPVINRASANDKALTAHLTQSKLIYFLGGFTGYLGETLKNSLAWEACLEAYQNGAIIAGSSAGAMVMCQYYYDPAKSKIVEGLGLLQNSLVLPHHNTFGKRWADPLRQKKPDLRLIGIDEQTAMLDSGTEQPAQKRSWQVYGAGQVVLYLKEGKKFIEAASDFVEDFN